MAPQTDIPITANVLGTIGTLLWCVQLIPQVWYNWKKKSTKGLPISMMVIWTLSATFFGAYTIIERFAIPIQIQPHIFGLLALMNLCQILLYEFLFTVPIAIYITAGYALMCGGLEALLIVCSPYVGDTESSVLTIGITASVLLVLGMVMVYWEIWKRKGQVIGISWYFLFIDWLGAVFSLLALAMQNTFDVLGGILYFLVILLEAGVFISHWLWLLCGRDVSRNSAEDTEHGEPTAAKADEN